jgi:hypothetical protein
VTTLVDLWRATDPQAWLVATPASGLAVAVRGVARSRAAAPQLPPVAEGQLMLVDATLVPVEPLDGLVAAIGEAGLAPAALLVAGVTARPAPPRDPAPMPILASERSAAALATLLARYLDDEAGVLDALAVEVRLACAEAALADPVPAAPAGIVAGRLRRGVAVAVDGALVALHARPAGQALAAQFVAAHARTLAAGTRRVGTRRTRDGLWVHESPVRPGASVFVFDDVPLARVDEVAAAALTATIRALLRRPVGPPRQRDAAPRQPPATGDPLTDTLLAVARANGRVATAARALGVHRNTVLYRLNRARAEGGLDPRRADDALRILRDDEDRHRE